MATNNKKERHSFILHIISGEKISNQKNLLSRLRDHGIHTTQATVSRDIRELGLVKMSEGPQGFRYLPRKGPLVEKTLIASGVVKEINSSGQLIVVRTRPGCAQSVAAAVDSLNWKEFLGTVGGDDTVIIVVKDPQTVVGIKKRLSLFFS